MTRYAARTDETHAAIRDGLRALGYCVRDTARLGQGHPDLVVNSRRGVTVWFEVKSEGGRLTKAERAWWDFHNVPGRVVFTLEDCVEMLEAIDNQTLG